MANQSSNNPPRPGRDELLQQINEALRAHGQPEWTDDNLGRQSDLACEVVRLHDVVPRGPDRVELELDFLLPVGGTSSRVRVGFGGQLIYVVPLLTAPEVEGGETVTRVCLCKRWRVELGQWTYQVPHGLGAVVSGTHVTDAFDSPAHQVVGRTFGSEFVDAISAARVARIGQFLIRGENARADAFMLAASALRPFRRRKGDGAPVLLTWKQVLTLIDGGEAIQDAHSIAVLLKAARKFGISTN